MPRRDVIFGTERDAIYKKYPVTFQQQTNDKYVSETAQLNFPILVKNKVNKNIPAATLHFYLTSNK